jgi:hypothetical protein
LMKTKDNKLILVLGTQKTRFVNGCEEISGQNTSQYQTDDVPAFLLKKEAPMNMPTLIEEAPHLPRLSSGLLTDVPPVQHRKFAAMVGQHRWAILAASACVAATAGLFPIYTSMYATKGKPLTMSKAIDSMNEAQNLGSPMTAKVGKEEDIPIVPFQPGMSSPVQAAGVATGAAESGATVGGPVPTTAPLKPLSLEDIKGASSKVQAPVPPTSAQAKPTEAKPVPAQAAKQDKSSKDKPEPKSAMVIDADEQAVNKSPQPTNKAAQTAAPVTQAAKAPEKKKLALVAITPDGKFALISNPATRLPERFAAGDTLPSGEKLISIDRAGGKVKTSNGEMNLE